MKKELKLWLKIMELELWLKATEGKTLPAGTYNIEEVETEEI